MSGLMKNFIDRILPACEPWMVKDPNHSGLSAHPDRYPRDRAMLLVSPCGFPEFDHFEPMLQYFQFYAQKLGWRYLGEILRPGGESLSHEQFQEMFAWYYSLVRQAGEQLRRLSWIFDWISWPLCGRHSLKTNLQSLVRDDRRRSGGISANPSLAGQSFA